MAPALKIGAFAALVSAAPALGCMLENTDFPGFDVFRLEGKVFSAKECQRQCQGRTDCFFWTFDEALNSCYLKSAEAKGAQTTAPGLISGPRVCSDKDDCFVQAMDYAGGDIINTQVVNALACQWQCQSVQGCQYWSFVEATARCFLKGASVTPTPLEGVVSGPRACPDAKPLACEMETDFYGHDLKAFLSTVSSAAQCQQLCKGFNNCFFWTFVESTASCYLKDETADEGRQGNPLTLSGARNCDLSTPPLPMPTTTSTAAPNCMVVDVDFQGHDVSSFGLGSVTTPEACQLMCQYTPECFYFTFFEGSCYFKSATATENAVAKLGAVSGPKNCDGAPTTTTTTTTTTTNTVTTTTNTVSTTTPVLPIPQPLAFLRGNQQ